MDRLSVERSKDTLTGTYNRYFLKEFVQFELNRKKRYGGHLTFLLCDLDNFKEANDLHGHLKGDEVLVMFARLLENNLRSSDIVVRYGGDEFILVLTDTPKHMSQYVAERIINQVKETKLLHDLNLGVSIGIASYPEDGKTLEELLKKSDQALYDAKKKGKGTFSFFSRDINLKPVIPAKTFTGRENILKELAACYTGNENRAIFIEGPVGIGKTRLVTESLKEQAHVLKTASTLFGNKIPYYEIKEILRNLYKKERSKFQNVLSLIDKFAQNAIYALLPQIALKEIVPLEDKFTLYEGIKRFLLKYFEDEPFILFIDDIQWVKHETLELVLYLLEQTTLFRTVMVKRTEETHPELNSFIENLQKLSHFKYIEIPPLSLQDTEKLLKLIMGEQVPVKLIEYAQNKSGGNPFFIEEIIRELFEQGYIKALGGEWIFNEPSSIPVSNSMEDVIKRKLRFLQRESIRILEIMALWDAPSNIYTLSLLSDMDEGEILFNLDRMEYLKLVSLKQNTYYITAGVIRNIILKGMTIAKKIAIHRKIATTLEHILPEHNEYIEKIAYHYFEAREKKKAIKYLNTAYDRAEKLKSYSTATELLKKILSIEDNMDKSLRLVSLLLETEGPEHAGNYLIKHMEKYGTTTKAMRLLAEIEERKGNIEKSIEILSSIETEDKALRYNILSDKTWLLMMLGKYDEAEEILENLLTFFNLNNQDEYYHTLHYLATIHYSKGLYEKSIQTAKQVISYFEEQEKIAFGALNTLALSLRSMGKYEEALEYFNKAIEYARKQGMPHSLATLLGNAALVYWDKYEYSTSKKYFEEAISLLTSMQAFDSAAFHMNNMIEMLIESGMVETGDISPKFIRKILNRVHAFTRDSTSMETRVLTFINEVEYANITNNKKEGLYWAGEIVNLLRDMGNSSMKCYGLTTVAYTLIDNCILTGALHTLRAVRRISKSIDTREWDIYTYSALYMLMKKANKDEKATFYLNTLLKMEDELPDELKVVYLERLYKIFQDTNNKKKARKYLINLLKLLEKIHADEKIKYIKYKQKNKKNKK